MRAMLSNEISFGHSTSQAPVLVQFPKPSASICATMFCTRLEASTLPCGSNAYCETFALTNSIADPFLQAARSEEHTSELQSRGHIGCPLLLEKKIITLAA